MCLSPELPSECPCRRRSTGGQRHAGRETEDGELSEEEGGGGGGARGSTERDELFRGARAAGPGGRPSARTAAEIKAAYGRNVAPGCVNSFCLRRACLHLKTIKYIIHSWCWKSITATWGMYEDW